MLGYGVIGPIGNRGADEGASMLISQLQSEPHSSGLGEAIGSGGFALAVIGGCVLLCSTRLRHVLWPVRIVGAMPLTAYVTHIVVWAMFIGKGPLEWALGRVSVLVVPDRKVSLTQGSGASASSANSISR